MQVRRLAAWTALPVALAIGLTACGGGDSGSSGGSAGAIVRQGIGDPEHLVPSNTVESNGSDVLNALFTPLVKFDGEGKPTFDGAAAESISSTDNTVWTVKLRDGFTFHNGEKVTSQSYIDAWNYAAYAPNAQIGTDFFKKIKGYADLQSPDGKADPKAKELAGLAKVDDNSFTITLDAPFAEWQKVVGYTVFDPLPKAAFEDMKKYEEAPIGQGPFKMVGTWERDKQISTERYDAYPLAKPKVAGVQFKIYSDQNTMYNDLLAGNLDVQTQLPSSVLGQAKTDLGDRLHTTPSSYYAWLTVPTYDPQFKPEIRKAISMAIDRNEITDRIFQGSYTPATSFVSPVVQGYRPDTCGEACEFNPTKAKELYTQAGGLAGNKLQLFYNEDGGHKEWVDAVCNQLKNNLGVECASAPVAKFADLRQQARAHTLQGLLRGAWSFDYPSMENYLTPIMGTGGSSNDSQYANPEFMALIKQGDSAATTDEAIKKYQQAEDLAAKDLPTIPMWFRQNIYGSSTKVTNVQMDLLTHVDLLQIEAA